MTRGRRACAC